MSDAQNLNTATGTTSRTRETTRDTARETTRDVLGVDSDTFAKIHSGIASAISEGFKAYSNEITPENLFRIDFGNGVLEGIMAGSASMMEEFAKTTRRVLDDTRAVRTRRARREVVATPPAVVAVPQVDYDRLAQLVAAEMRKNPVIK
jgi:hypothetical protein